MIGVKLVLIIILNCWFFIVDIKMEKIFVDIDKVVELSC